MRGGILGLWCHPEWQRRISYRQAPAHGEMLRFAQHDGTPHSFTVAEDWLAAGEDDSKTIEIKVRLYAGLRQYLPDIPLGQSATIQLPSGTTVGELLDRLSIPRRETKSCFVNGVNREFSYPLSEGDELAAFPAIAGG